MYRGSIVFVKAFPDFYQGDLILNDDNVTIIEGHFEINGSIFVEENATLILRNAIVNFTTAGSGIFMQNPANGNPRLQAENTEIVGLSDNRFYDNSSATFSNFTTNAFFYLSDKTNVTVLDSTFGGIQARDFSTVTISNSTLQNLSIVLMSGNASVVTLSSGFFKHWDFWVNCSVAFKLQTSAPDVALNQTTINTWSFSFQGTSTATITKCILSQLHANMAAFPSGNIDVYDSVISTVELYSSTTVTLTNTTCTLLDPRQSSKIDVYWYLDVHVLDDSPTPGQSVQLANATAVFSNGTLAKQALTGVDGWTRLTLMEKMKNATGDYPVGTYSINATYLSYSSGATANMTENQAITLTLEGFIIPEFPSSLILPLLMTAALFAVIVYRRKHA
jgi:5-hydroxyisourate hydrolase-like protein (transthyretin family)